MQMSLPRRPLLTTIYRSCLTTTRALTPPPARHASSVRRIATHSTLEQFFSHARRSNLSQRTTVFVGTHYEYTVINALRKLGVCVTRTGGAGDRGVDAKGFWCLPDPDADADAALNFQGALDERDGRSSVNATTGLSAPGSTTNSTPRPASHKVQLIVQCKSLRSKPDPKHVRELEGALTGVQKLGYRPRGQASSTRLIDRVPYGPGPFGVGWPETEAFRYANSGADRPSDSLDATPTSSPEAGGSLVSRTDNHHDTLTHSRYGAPKQLLPRLALLVTPHPATLGVREALARSSAPLVYALVRRSGRVAQLIWNAAANSAPGGFTAGMLSQQRIVANSAETRPPFAFREDEGEESRGAETSDSVARVSGWEAQMREFEKGVIAEDDEAAVSNGKEIKEAFLEWRGEPWEFNWDEDLHNLR